MPTRWCSISAGSHKRVNSTGCQGTREATPGPASDSEEGFLEHGLQPQWPRRSGHMATAVSYVSAIPKWAGSDSAYSFDVNKNEIVQPTWESWSISAEGLSKQVIRAKRTCKLKLASFRNLPVAGYQLCLRGVAWSWTNTLPLLPLNNLPEWAPIALASSPSLSRF